ncbi:DUF6483 family protein [Paenibacillus sp. 1001270B_150601_E10]|uniref:DUF6483 family protein n=1 Tax=Paenibacillus sp. 1001270B_150601_E10 TaxID=2787079 RepID=UPI0018A0B6B6|nr:DUF6483 family protein [Paenibacillus sp. 1001270B_150601_E10]
MYQRDYLMRIIQEMTTMLGQLLGLQHQKKRTELLEDWDDLLDRRFRIKGELADSLSSQDLIKLFYRHGHIQADELQAFAIAFAERAQLIKDVALDGDERGNAALQRDDIEAYYIGRMMKAYSLLLTAQLQGSDRQMLAVDKIMEEMSHRLRPYKLDDDLLELLWHWHARDQRYSEAENACYEWMERDVARLKKGLAWYERLMEESDEELAASSLPRDEVEQAIIDIKRRMASASMSDEEQQPSDFK